jgi:hypothetical protein
MGVDERGFGDSDGGTLVMATTNFSSLAAYYVKSNAF